MNQSGFYGMSSSGFCCRCSYRQGGTCKDRPWVLKIWYLGENERTPPPKKAATKEQVEHPPWSQKNQGGSCSQIRRDFRHQGLARHSQCQLRWHDLYCLPWSCSMKRWIRIGPMPVPVYQIKINMRRAEMPQWLHPWEHEGDDMESRQILQAYREVINTCVHRYQYIEILLQRLLALARLSRIKHLYGLFFRNSQWYMNTFIYLHVYMYIYIHTYCTIYPFIWDEQIWNAFHKNPKDFIRALRDQQLRLASWNFETKPHV